MANDCDDLAAEPEHTHHTTHQRGEGGRIETRALGTSSCNRVITTQVNVQSMRERSSRVREYTCDNNR